MRIPIIFLLLIITGQVPAKHSQITGKPLVVGCESDYPPFMLGNTDETADGFTVDLWKAVAAESHVNYIPSRQIF